MKKGTYASALSALLFLAGCVGLPIGGETPTLSPASPTSGTMPTTPRISGQLATRTHTAVATAQATSVVLTGTPLPVAVAGSAPTWEGLTPGKSTLLEVAMYVDASVPRGASVGIGPPLGNGQDCRDYRWNSDRTGHNEVVSENKVLLRIVAQPPPGTTLRHLVARYGPPEFIHATLSGPAINFYHQEVYYPKLGLAFVVTPDQNKVGKVEPDFPVLSGHYTTPGDLRHLLLNAMRACVYDDPLVAQAYTDRDLSWARPWPGFGPVEVIKFAWPPPLVLPTATGVRP